MLTRQNITYILEHNLSLWKSAIKTTYRYHKKSLKTIKMIMVGVKVIEQQNIAQTSIIKHFSNS